MSYKTWSWTKVVSAVLLACRLAVPGVRAADAYYAGRCADGRAVCLLLSGRGAKANVELHLEGTWPEGFAFRTNAPDRIEFGGEEIAADDQPRHRVKGCWLAVANRADGLAGGIRVAGSSTELPFTLLRVATRESVSRKRGVHFLGRGGGKQFEAAWPGFTDKLPFHVAVSRFISAQAHGDMRQFTTGAAEIAWEAVRVGGGRSFDWDGSLATDLICLEPNLVSLFLVEYEFTGGAHGNTKSAGRNFFLAGGKAREFALGDLFRSGSGWEKALSRACLRELRSQHASWVMPDAEPKMRIDHLKPADLASFNVDRSGLLVHFDPYAVGPYAEGMFHVAISWRELDEFLDLNGPAGTLHAKK